MIPRIKVNGNYGVMKYGDFGVTMQFDRYFTAGVYGNTIINDLRVKNPTGQNIYNTKLNKGRSFILVAGVSTQAPAKIHFTALAGLSFGQYNVHDNVQLTEHPSGSLYITSDAYWTNLLGFGLKGEMTFAISERLGVNAGVLGNFNPKFSYFRVYIGLSLGKMGFLI